MMKEPQATAIFVADSHFHLDPDPAEQDRVRRFVELLDISCRADHLVLLGDIFDFWFDYPHFRLKGYDTIFQALDRVKAAGTRIHFIGGNHDIWAADYMHRRYGASPRGHSTILTLGSTRIRLVHGDGMVKFDWAYNAFRSMVRNPAGILLAKSLHPEILYAFSVWLSGQSRGATRDEAVKIEKSAMKWLRKQQAPDWDMILIGHVHHAFEITHDGISLAALAGWFEQLGYGLFQDGSFTLMDFDRDPAPEL